MGQVGQAILERITQTGLAAQLGVAVGSVNWYIKRLIEKGYVKATRMQRSRLKYFVTPEGLALKARLTSQYMEVSLRGTRIEYRRTGNDEHCGERRDGAADQEKSLCH